VECFLNDTGAEKRNDWRSKIDSGERSSLNLIFKTKNKQTNSNNIIANLPNVLLEWDVSVTYLN